MTSAFDQTIPETAAPKVEFISLSHLNPSTELNPVPTQGIDLTYFRKYVRSLEEGGYDYTLLPYGAGTADSFVVASAVGQLTERLKPIVALRPNTTFPLVAAQKLATLDQLTEGRAVVHLISGGSDAEQARQGDYLPKHRRYARTSEFIDLLRRAWTEPGPFSHEGEFYKFDDFGPGFAPYDKPIPISIGGQSDEAFAVGGEKADIFSFWGEPLDDLRSEIERVHAIARAAGRTTLPRIWVTFRPIIAKTDELAWQKAHSYVAKIADTFSKAAFGKQPFQKGAPQNVGSQRALSFAARSELYDRALWTRTAAVTNAGGASTALVGSPETVAAAILDYVDRGADLVSIRGYNTLADAVDYGRHVLPLVHQELAHRAATGRRGTLQAEHLGNYAEDYRRYATAPGVTSTIPDLASVTAELAETAAEYDQSGEVPVRGLEVAHRAGLLTATVGKQFGGPGAGPRETARILTALGEGDPSVALIVANTLNAHAAQAAQPHWPTALYEDVLQRPGPAPINAIRAEPELGAPARGGLPKTSLTRTASGWILNGHKAYATGGTALAYHVVWAVADERVGHVIVPGDLPGITWDHLGLRASNTHDVIYEGVELPEEAFVEIPRDPDGVYRDPAATTGPGSFGHPALYIGVARAARQAFADFARSRVPAALGKPIATTERIQSVAGEIDLQLATAETLLHGALLRIEAGDESVVPQLSVIKVAIARAVVTAVQTAVAALGNPALSRRNRLERHLRDVLCVRVHPPQEDTALLTAGRRVLGA